MEIAGDDGTPPAFDGPVVAGKSVYVVDRDVAELIEVDSAAHKVVHREPLEVEDPAKVELRVESDTVFVNDLSSEYALVVRDGEITRLDKYTDEGVAVSEPPEPAPVPPTPRPTPPTERPSTAPVAPAVPAVAPSAPAAAVPPAWVEPARPPEGEPGEPPDTVPPTTSTSTTTTTTTAPPALEKPGEPGAVTADAGDGQATISWSAPVDGGAPEAYELRMQGAPRPLQRVPATETSFRVKGLTNGQSYVVEVLAVNEAGRSASVASPPFQPTPAAGPPGAIPGNITVSPGDSAVGLGWNPAPANGGTQLKYRVDIAGGPGQGQQVVDQPQIAVGNLQNGVSYTFTITPFNEHGDGPASSATARPARGPQVSLVSPEFNGDLRSNSAFRVTAQVDGGGLPTTCQVAVLDGAGQVVAPIPFDCAAAAQVDTPLFATEYRFEVIATNELGSASGIGDVRVPPKTITLISDRLTHDPAFTPGQKPGIWASPTVPQAAEHVPNRTDVEVDCWIDDGGYNADNHGSSRVWAHLVDGSLGAPERDRRP